MIDLAVPGLTSGRLLDALERHRDEQILHSVAVITLDIGGNDILRALPGSIHQVGERPSRIRSDPVRVGTRRGSSAATWC